MFNADGSISHSVLGKCLFITDGGVSYSVLGKHLFSADGGISYSFQIERIFQLKTLKYVDPQINSLKNYSKNFNIVKYVNCLIKSTGK